MNENMKYFNSLPTPKLRITSRYGKRNTGIKGASTFHRGIDLGGSGADTPILAVRRGIVAENYWNDIRGWVLVIRHSQRYATLYQHLKERSSLPVGAYVEAEQKIGIMGNSSNKLKIATHLHMELHDNGQPVDFESWLRNIKGVEEDMTEQELRTIIKDEINSKLTGKGSTVSPWAEKDWDEAIKDGVTDGAHPKGYTTREQVIVMINRSMRATKEN